MDGIISNVGQVQNSKQMSYMMDIKNVGMGILFGQTTSEIYTETFEKYIDYIEQPSQNLCGYPYCSSDMEGTKTLDSKP